LSTKQRSHSNAVMILRTYIYHTSTCSSNIASYFPLRVIVNTIKLHLGKCSSLLFLDATQIVTDHSKASCFREKHRKDQVWDN
jgi:hypothetical protein